MFFEGEGGEGVFFFGRRVLFFERGGVLFLEKGGGREGGGRVGRDLLRPSPT